jgi:hypothetical protein
LVSVGSRICSLLSPFAATSGPGDMIHINTQEQARFECLGHRITGDRRLGSSRGAGYEKAHVAIDDATRLAYVEVLPDEKQATTVDFSWGLWPRAD